MTSTAEPPPRLGAVVLALVAGQVGVHAAMTGLRMAAPLDALEHGASALVVGILMALFAVAPVLLALRVGRMADRLGYHRPVRLAVAVTMGGLALAIASTLLPSPWRLLVLGVGAMCAGAGANIGLIVVQRAGSLVASDGIERMRIFSWLAAAPSLSNVVGPLLAGLLIDAAGFGAAYAVLLALPCVALWSARHVPTSAPRDSRPRAHATSFDLLGLPGFKRLLFVNWLFSASWDVHSFAVPILGHQRGFSATTIALVLGAFTLAVTAVRLLIPVIAHRVREATAVRAALLATCAVFALYPLATSPAAMAFYAVALGLALGGVGPMVMVMMHKLTPDDRHGEALAFRSMAINASSAVLPLVFGALGAAVGAGALFWVIGVAVGAGSLAARGLAQQERADV